MKIFQMDINTNDAYRKYMTRQSNTSKVVTDTLRSHPMARRPGKIKSDQDLVRVTLLLPADDVREVDAEAQRMSASDPYRRTLTRSDVIRSIVHEGLQARRKK
jgi:hypothetical protein